MANNRGVHSEQFRSDQILAAARSLFLEDTDQNEKHRPWHLTVMPVN